MRHTLAAAGFLLLAACAQGVTHAPPGLFQPEAGFAIMLSGDWSYVPEHLNPYCRGGFITRDGVTLNRVHFVTLRPGDSLLRGDRDAEIPRYRDGLTDEEKVAFITASLEGMGYGSLKLVEQHARELDGAPGARIAFTARQETGLDIRGEAALAERAGRLHLIIYLAPAIHYYDRDADAVDKLMNSFRFTLD